LISTEIFIGSVSSEDVRVLFTAGTGQEIAKESINEAGREEYV
jgi:hypothetical protein